MNTRPLVVITTRLSPQVCGIGAYSWLLHRHWPGSRPSVRFLVIDDAAQSIKELDHPAIAEFNSRPGALARELNHAGPADILLHYAGRAYHRYGCPWWLPSVLAGWKKRFPSGRLMVLFHELPGSFPVTSRHYWIDMCNRRVIRKLATVADALITNTAEHANKLKNISERTDIHWFPVPSNIPVEAKVSTARVRTEFIIFGLPFGRWQILQMFDEEIRSWSESGHLTKLHLVGPPDEKFETRADELINAWRHPDVVTRHGMLPAAEVSRLLARAQFSLANANIDNWSKSTVFMAFASHGCPVVSKIKSAAAPLCFVVAPEEVATIDDIDLAEKSRSLQEWYRAQADWNVIAKKISILLPGNTEQETAA